MRCIRAGVPDFGAWMHYGPRPRDADRGRGCAVRSVAAAAAATCVAATLLVLEVRDHLLDLGLVLRLAGLLDQLRRDARSDELPDHACHVRLLVVDCLLGAPTNGRPTAFPTRSAGRAVVDVADHPAEVGVAGTRRRQVRSALRAVRMAAWGSNQEWRADDDLAVIGPEGSPPSAGISLDAEAVMDLRVVPFT